MSFSKYPPQEFTINGASCNAHRINHTINGVPRWVITLVEACNLLGIEHTRDNCARAEIAIRAGVFGNTYRGKWLPHALVFQSYDIKQSLARIQEADPDRA